MKKLLLILLCLPFIGFGQTDDVLKLQDDVLKLQDKVSDINYKMAKHHKQFYTGVALNFSGVGLTIIGGVVMEVPFIMYIGGGIALAGGVVMIISHKWFKNNTKKDIIGYSEFEKRNKQLDDLWERGEITKSDLEEERRKNKVSK